MKTGPVGLMTINIETISPVRTRYERRREGLRVRVANMCMLAARDWAIEQWLVSVGKIITHSLSPFETRDLIKTQILDDLKQEASVFE